MNSAILWLFLASLTICYATHESSSSMSEELRKELREFADKRMSYMLKNGPPKEPYMTMSITLTDCRMITGLPKISSGWNQMILEEEVCSTSRMTRWCEEKPGRQAILTTWNEKANRTALAHFQCHHVNPIKSNNNRERTLINCLVAVAMFAIIRSWYLTCTRPVPVHPSKILNLSPNPPKSHESDSFESITFDTTKTRTKSRIGNSCRTSFNNTSANKFRIIV